MEYWDPLRRKNVAATPEEKVRQWFISELENRMKVPRHMMMSEVSLSLGDKPYRADIVVYGRSGAPLAVVECKRPQVAISEETARQAMRYNAVLSVRWLFLTNGGSTYIYRFENGGFVPVDHVPDYEEMKQQI